MITKIAHTAMKVTDMERAVAFYCGGWGSERLLSCPTPRGIPGLCI